MSGPTPMNAGLGFHTHGFALVQSILSPSDLRALEPVVLREGAVGGSRCLLSRPQIATLATTLRTHPALRTLIPDDHVAVQCTYFEKSSNRNWLVPLHQDLSLPVARRVDAPALRGWSQKEGSVFVQAPRAVLEQVLAVRLHLDHCGPSDGPLRAVPGSHQLGILGPEEGAAVRAQHGETTCVAAAGDVLLMRPLVLHASSKSTGQSQRRVLHFLYGPPRLPFGLDWAMAVR